MKGTCFMMKQNEGTIDRVLRVVIGSFALLAGFFWLTSTVQIIAYVVGVVALFTGFVGYCGLYTLIRVSTCPIKKRTKPDYKITVLLSVLAVLILVTGTYASITITRKKFLEDFNRINGYYKQTLFLTGQTKRDEAKIQYDQLVSAYSDFKNKYEVYRPFVIRNDHEFSKDVARVEDIIYSVKEGVYTGDLPQTHIQLEAIRPVFQEMFKRNGFSMLSIALVDFHDIMEKLITAADAKDSETLLDVYPQADQTLQLIENEDSSPDIKSIRKNLTDLYDLAKTGKISDMSAKAAELKASFIKVYLQKG